MGLWLLLSVMALPLLQHTIEQLSLFELLDDISLLIYTSPIYVYHYGGEAVDGNDSAECCPTEMIVNYVVVGKCIEKQAHQYHAEQYVDGFKADVALDDILAAKRDIVGHAEQFLYD